MKLILNKARMRASTLAVELKKTRALIYIWASLVC